MADTHGVRSIAMITARAARAQDTDSNLLAQALREQGWSAAIIDWDDMEVDWSKFKLAVLRSTWDYTVRLSEFLEWLDRTARATRIVNPPEVVRWSLDKHYLAELQRAGLPTVPTAFVEPGDDAAAVVGKFLRQHEAAEFVIKPAVGAGAQHARRLSRGAASSITVEVSRLLAGGRSVLLQPYLERVDVVGETALIYFQGQFSHAIGKNAVLHRDHAPMRELIAPEKIAARVASTDELALGAQLFRQLPFATPSYARLDLLRDANGVPCVLELELAEPSLYLGYAGQAPAQFAAALIELAQA